MKRILLLAVLVMLVWQGRAQNTIITLYGGAGAPFKYAYDAAISGGLTFVKAGRGRTGFGAQLFYQGITFKYDKEAYGVHDGGGRAGVIIQNASSYVFVAPRVSQFFGKRSNMEAYLNVGGGFKMSGKETMRKWDNTHGVSAGDYDSTIDTSPNINSMLIRVGMGIVEYTHVSKSNWWFSFTEDFGFVTSSYTKSSDVNYPSRTPYSPAHKLNPLYFSVHIGISHSKTRY